MILIDNRNSIKNSFPYFYLIISIIFLAIFYIFRNKYAKSARTYFLSPFRYIYYKNIYPRIFPRDM